MTSTRSNPAAAARAASEHAADSKPKRVTLSEIVTQLLARSGGDRSSVTLTRNAKGVTQIDVTVRTGDHSDVVTALDAERVATEIYERLRGRYPMPDGYVGAEGAGKGETS